MLLPLSYGRGIWINGRGGRIRTCVRRVKAGCLRPLEYAPIDSGDELVPSVRVERTCRVAPASETGASAYSATRGMIWMDALGGDRPESNRHLRSHIPQLCH